MQKTDYKSLFNGKKFGEILFDEPMKNHTSFKIGGPADVLVIPKKETEIIDSIEFCRENNLEYFIMGNGTNLLVKDSGIRKVVIKIASDFGNIEINGKRVVCQSGALLSVVGKRLLRECLTGFEFASGIPGSIGGAITMNAGAYGGEMKDIAINVRALDKKNNIVNLNNSDMDFRYRGSRIVDEELIVLSAEFKLKSGEYSIIEEEMKDLTYKRTTKQPLEWASGGSTFKRPEGYYAGKLIDDSGLRGIRYGDAQVSEKHCGFLINRGDSSYREVTTLIKTIQKIVRDKFNVELETEIKIIGD